jgi:hypothetical protein
MLAVAFVGRDAGAAVVSRLAAVAFTTLAGRPDPGSQLEEIAALGLVMARLSR